jgi:hypothetical protein
LEVLQPSDGGHTYFAKRSLANQRKQFKVFATNNTADLRLLAEHVVRFPVGCDGRPVGLGQRLVVGETRGGGVLERCAIRLLLRSEH